MNIRKYFSFLALLIVIIASLFIGNEIRNRYLGTTDSSALLYGRLETGYPQAGYLLGYNDGQLADLCSATLIDNNIAITAAHCLDKAENFKLGFGQFSTNEDLHFSVIQKSQHAAWNKQTSDNDFAVVKINRTVTLSDYAQITSPKLGCSYRIVAYGRNEDESEGLTLNRPRKSAQICITTIENNTFRITSPEGGLCTGDSGSPIFEEGSNNIVGVISAIQKVGSDPCFINNIGIATKADSKLSYFAGFTSKKIQGTTSITAAASPDNNSAQTTTDLQQIFVSVGNFFNGPNAIANRIAVGVIFFALLLAGVLIFYKK